jgi:steroid 5-alpha reductase family enzyme
MPGVTFSSKQGGTVDAIMCYLTYFAALQSAVLVTTTATRWRLLLPAALGGGGGLIAQGLYASVCATLVVFAFSYVLDNTSLYDPYWSIAPCALTAFWARHAAATAPGALAPRQWLAVALVWCWALRLLIGVPWRGWREGLPEEDWRHVEVRARTGGGLRYWAVSLFSLHLAPTLLVFACLRPFGLAIIASPLPLQVGKPTVLSSAEICAALVCVVAIAIESVADEQLRRYRQSDAYRRGGCCEIGLWKYSRHPK